MKVFCFHSIRGKLAIPQARAWPSEALYDEYVKYLTVNPEWFRNWVDAALGKWGEDLVLTFDDAYSDILIPVSYALRQAEKEGKRIRVIVFVPTAYIGEIFPYAPYRVMTESELRFLHSNRVEIGLHGHQHVSWMERGLAEVCDDLEIGLDVLRRKGFKDVKSVAPPHGWFDEDHLAAAQHLGLDVFGTTIYPAGYGGSIPRALASMEGYIDEDMGKLKKWPWEE